MTQMSKGRNRRVFILTDLFSGHSKDSCAAGGAVEEDGVHQRSSGNQQDPEDGAREAGARAAAGSGQSEHWVLLCVFMLPSVSVRL